jgi:hypothetical protein
MYLASEGATYTVPFPYLHLEDLRVFAGDVGDAVEQPIKWLSPTEFQVTSKLPEQILVTARRFTRRDDLLTVFHDGGQLPASDMNVNSKQLLYIMQEQLDFGTYGGSGLPGGGSGWPMPDGSTPNPAITQIIDAVMQSPIMKLLLERIDPIDSTAETLLDEILRSDQRFNERRKVEKRVALAETDITTLVTDTSSMAQQITELYAQHDDTAAQIVEVRQVIATETEARATAITQVNAAIGGAESRITDVRQAVTTETEARAQAITKLASDFKAADDNVTKAISQTLTTTYATKDYAKTISTQQVEAWASGSFAILQNRFEAFVDGTADPTGNPKWQANWSLKIDAGRINGVPVIAGIGLGASSQGGSTFTVLADRFAFASPRGGGVVSFPFVAGRVGGVDTVGITGQLIVDGSISAQKITTNSLSAISANMGTVNGGIFRTYQLDAYGNVIDPNEFRVEITNNPNDPWPFWIGAGVKNANNAVVWFDRNGNAAFNGTIRAQNMIDQLQSTATASWTGDLTASGGGVAVQFDLPAPTRLGQQHLPVIHVECKINNTSGSPSTGGIYLERFAGGSWQQVKVHNHIIGGGATDFDSMLSFDAIATGTVTYRVRIGLDPFSNTRPENFHITQVTAYAFGLR